MPWGQNLPQLDARKAQLIRESEQVIAQNYDYLHTRISEFQLETPMDNQGPYFNQITGLATFCRGEYEQWGNLIPFTSDELTEAHNRLEDICNQLQRFESNAGSGGNSFAADDERLGLLGGWIQRAEAIVEPMLPPLQQEPADENRVISTVGQALRKVRAPLPPKTPLTSIPARVDELQMAGGR